MPSSDKIKARRLALKLSQEELVALLRPYWPKVDWTIISKIERGVRRVKLEEAHLLAMALQCTVADLTDPPVHR